MKFVLALLLLLLTCALPARAEIFLCNGRWTNVPCAGEAQKAIDETKRKVLSPSEAMQMSEKRSLLHELTMKRIRAREDYGLEADIEYAQKICSEQTTSLERCRNAVREADERLSDRMAQLELVQEQRRANELQRERNRLEAERAATATTVIIERDPFIHDFDHHRRPDVNVTQQVVVQQQQQQVVKPPPPRRRSYRGSFGR